MAVDKLVDSTQLDSDLTSVANAIRAKSGGSGQLAFPAGFVSEIGNISGGGDAPEVPTGYTQLAYIETDGNSLIDTGFTWSETKKIEFSWAHDGAITKAQFSHPFGATGCFVQYKTSGFCSICNVMLNNNSYENMSNSGIPETPNTLTVLPNSLTAKGYKVDSPAGTLVSRTGTAETGPTFAIGGRHKTSGYDGKAAGTIIYRWKMYDNDVLVQDLVPAIRDADSVLGMYDLVNNSFLTNAGSGSFTGGSM